MSAPGGPTPVRGRASPHRRLSCERAPHSVQHGGHLPRLSRTRRITFQRRALPKFKLVARIRACTLAAQAIDDGTAFRITAISLAGEGFGPHRSPAIGAP